MKDIADEMPMLWLMRQRFWWSVGTDGD